MEIYVVTCVNEDGWVSIVGSYKNLERAKLFMRQDWSNTCESLHQEGFIPTMKRDELCATLAYGNGHYYKYQINTSTLR